MAAFFAIRGKYYEMSNFARNKKQNESAFLQRKYENSSLNYTGIDKHEGESIGGWDTVLRREEYEALYSKQQATVTDLTDAIISSTETKTVPESSAKIDTTSAKKTVNPEKQEKPQIDWENILADVGVGMTVKHKMFGEGTISKMDKAKKYIHVKFKKGEKQFVFPDAFIGGFLSLQ